MACPHTRLEADIDFATWDGDDNSVAWGIHLKLWCSECHQRFGFKSRDGRMHPRMSVEIAPMLRDGVPDVAH